jgi:uncharacterized delta-60 repeat protein
MLKRDGRIIVAGVDNEFVNVCCSNAMVFNIALIRYTREGKLDPGFGKRGAVLTRFENGPQVNAAVLEGKGKIVVAGGIFNRRRRGSDFLLVRYSPDGSVDS